MWARTIMKREKFAIANIYVPVKRRATLKPDTVREIAQSMLEVGQTTPILGPVLSCATFSRERIRIKRGTPLYNLVRPYGRGIQIRR
jgi:hypothetical protein